jgi:hypothetical protein
MEHYRNIVNKVRKMVCPDCLGEIGKIPCDNCNGTGKMFGSFCCSECNGSGKKTCRYCRGKGTIYYMQCQENGKRIGE